MCLPCWAVQGGAGDRHSESTGREAKTIRRLLETDPRTGNFRRNEEVPLDCDLVVDEKRLVVLVGQRKALAIAIKGGRSKRRWSKLREWLKC